jgi:RNase P subunit RPR2
MEVPKHCKKPMKLISVTARLSNDTLYFQCEKCGEIKRIEVDDCGELTK